MKDGEARKVARESLCGFAGGNTPGDFPLRAHVTTQKDDDALLKRRGQTDYFQKRSYLCCRESRIPISVPVDQGPLFFGKRGNLCARRGLDFDVVHRIDRHPF